MTPQPASASPSTPLSEAVLSPRPVTPWDAGTLLASGKQGSLQVTSLLLPRGSALSLLSAWNALSPNLPEGGSLRSQPPGASQRAPPSPPLQASPAPAAPYSVSRPYPGTYPGTRLALHTPAAVPRVPLLLILSPAGKLRGHERSVSCSRPFPAATTGPCTRPGPHERR